MATKTKPKHPALTKEPTEGQETLASYIAAKTGVEVEASTIVLVDELRKEFRKSPEQVEAREAAKAARDAKVEGRLAKIEAQAAKLRARLAKSSVVEDEPEEAEEVEEVEDDTEDEEVPVVKKTTKKKAPEPESDEDEEEDEWEEEDEDF